MSHLSFDSRPEDVVAPLRIAPTTTGLDVVPRVRESRDDAISLERLDRQGAATVGAFARLAIAERIEHPPLSGATVVA
jgi:hypothetical protein